MTEPEPLQQIDRTYVLYRKRRLSYYSGCDYFRLSSHPEVVQSVSEGLARFGLNVSASRLTTGSHRLYFELERKVANFFGAKSAVLMSCGYLTNLAFAQAFRGEFSHVLIDERAHVSLKNAAEIIQCPIIEFSHLDARSLANRLKFLGKTFRPLVMTDGMFSHDGSVAPIKEYLKVLPENGRLLIDDAHGAGVIGPSGKGSLEHCKVARTRVIQNVTLSKAFGVYGGVILGAAEEMARVKQASHLFVGNTPLPLPLAQAALTSIRLVRSDAAMRKRLSENVHFLRSKLSKYDILVPENPGPIVAFSLSEHHDIRAFQKHLLKRGIYPPLMRYPGIPGTGFFRFALSSEHSKEQLENAASAIHEAWGVSLQ